MKASVIIPTKNPGSIFHQVLAAVTSQATPWEYEVLVIDSGSTDGTLELVRATPGVKLHEIPSSEFGHGKTRNLGIAMTRGEFIAVITHDALPANELWLAELVEATEQDTRIAGAFGRHLAYEHDGPFMERDLRLHFAGFLEWPPVVYLEDKLRYESDSGYRQFLHFFSDNNACIRRAVWEKIPYPEVDFAEDQLWAKEIIEAGYSKAYAHNSIVYHSHTFDSVDWCRRSFDEARALKKLFGYQLCPSFGQLITQSLKVSINDFKYFYSRGKPRSELTWLIKTCISNFTRQLGMYLGQRAEKMPSALADRISRDASIRKK